MFLGDEYLRTFYIFKINKEFKTITKNKPYNLYLALDNIHKMDSKDLKLAYRLFDEICDINKNNNLNASIFNEFKDNDAYTKFNNNHLIYDYYTRENSKLTINKSYLKLKSTSNNPIFFDVLKDFPNLFVIDFCSKDYFWLS